MTDKTFAKQAGAALLAITLLSSPALADPTETAKAAGKDASWLFIQTAQKVTFDGKTLTLSGVDPSVVMFNDRPKRGAEVLPTTTFLSRWDAGGKGRFQSDKAVFTLDTPVLYKRGGRDCSAARAGRSVNITTEGSTPLSVKVLPSSGLVAGRQAGYADSRRRQSPDLTGACRWLLLTLG
jgi:hypothetical protein